MRFTTVSAAADEGCDVGLVFVSDVLNAHAASNMGTKLARTPILMIKDAPQRELVQQSRGRKVLGYEEAYLNGDAKFSSEY